MKDETITGSTDSNGIFTAENPHVKKFSGFEYTNFEAAHPPLLCYNENNELVKGVEGLEVKSEPVYEIRFRNRYDYGQFKSWHRISKEQYDNRVALEHGAAWEVRAFYIAVQPTGTTLDKLNAISKTDSKFVEKAQARKDQHTPLPEAQPLEGVKFTHPFRVGRKQNRAVLDANGIEVVVFRKGLQDMAMNYCNMLNAQFATEAGGGKEISAETILSRYEPMEHESFGGIDRTYTADDCIHMMEAYAALTATSNNSSSEMVGEWISVKDRLPMDNQIVTAKNKHSGQVGKDVSFKDGKFYHKFTSTNSLETTDIEFKNVTEWKSV